MRACPAQENWRCLYTSPMFMYKSSADGWPPSVCFCYRWIHITYFVIWILNWKAGCGGVWLMEVGLDGGRTDGIPRETGHGAGRLSHFHNLQASRRHLWHLWRQRQRGRRTWGRKMMWGSGDKYGGRTVRLTQTRKAELSWFKQGGRNLGWQMHDLIS